MTAQDRQNLGRRVTFPIYASRARKTSGVVKAMSEINGEHGHNADDAAYQVSDRPFVMCSSAKLQPCYIFSATDDRAVSERPSKKRKTARTPQKAQRQIASPFLALLNGQEKEPILRYDTYQKLWGGIEVYVGTKAATLTKTVQDLVHFIEEDVSKSQLGARNNKPQAALVVSRQESIAYKKLVSELKHSLNKKSLVIEIDSTQNGNLKNALKAIVKSGITQRVGVDKSTEFLASRKVGIQMAFVWKWRASLRCNGMV